MSQFNETQCEREFDRFCKTVLTNELRDALRKREYRVGRMWGEISMEFLTPKEAAKLSTVDRYDFEENTFMVMGESVIIEDDALANALHSLAADQRELFLLEGLYQFNDREISEMRNCTRRTVQRVRQKTLQKLKDLLTELEG